MSDTRSRPGILVAVAAAAGAFGAAAMVSAASAPTARADDTTLIIDAIQGDFAQGQADFTTGLADFGKGGISSGLAELLNSTNEYTLAPTDNLLLGGVEALEGDPITSSLYFDDLYDPGNFANALAQAQEWFSQGEAFLTNGAAALSAGDYGSGTYLDLAGSATAFVLPVEELLIGVATAFDPTAFD
jgi:hypothetical protein